MTAADTRAGLDNRVTDDDGRPVREYRFMRWFRIRRSDQVAGVILRARIPGYLDEDQLYQNQGAARSAARRIYDQYKDAVRALSQED